MHNIWMYIHKKIFTISRSLGYNNRERMVLRGLRLVNSIIDPSADFNILIFENSADSNVLQSCSNRTEVKTHI